MRLRDALGELYQDEQFVALYSVEGQPGYAPWRLALVLVLQYVENLTDRQAANAVRERIDWKYLLGLQRNDPGFDYSLLTAFRTRLVEASAETLLLDRLLEVCKQRGWLKEGGKQRTDSTHVLARVRSLSNLECVGETLRATLDDLAHFSIDWDKQQAICPQGQTSSRLSRAKARMEIVFAPEVCAACPVRQECTHSQTTGQVLHLRPQAAHEALQARRLQEQTPEFRHQYALRSGIEATLSQAVRGMGIRRSRYDGLARTHVQHVLTAAAINLVRIDAVLTHHPRGKTRRSHFSQLASTPALPVRIGA